MHVFTETANKLELGLNIGTGGEASVFLVVGQPSVVAKVYHSYRMTPDRLDKLAYMVRNPPHDPCLQTGAISIAWPRELLYSDKNRTDFCGFIMPLIDDYRPLACVYFPADRKRTWPLFDWKYLVYAARNVASSLAALHEKGYVVGDVNESNILVRDTAQIAFIDTDSFQVTTPQGVHRCTVGKSEFTPPENQGRDFGSMDRAPDHDCFALAVLVFLLLMEGRHPFDGVAAAPSLSGMNEQAEKIQANFFRLKYAANGEVAPPPKCPKFTMLPDSVRDLLMRCLVDGETSPSARPTALEWMDTLDDVGRSLVSCSVNRQHQFSAHLSECPWCERMQIHSLADPFPSQASLSQAGQISHRKQSQPQTARSAAHSQSSSPRLTRSTPVQTPSPRTVAPARPVAPARAVASPRTTAPQRSVAPPRRIASRGVVARAQVASPTRQQGTPQGVRGRAAPSATPAATPRQIPLSPTKSPLHVRGGAHAHVAGGQAPPVLGSTAGRLVSSAPAFSPSTRGMKGGRSGAASQQSAAPVKAGGSVVVAPPTTTAPPSQRLTSVALPPVSWRDDSE